MTRITRIPLDAKPNGVSESTVYDLAFDMPNLPRWDLARETGLKLTTSSLGKRSTFVY